MSQIDFPTNPSNGDTLTAGNITWTFNSTVGVWQNNVIGLSGAAITIAADSGSNDTVTLGVDTLNLEGGTGLTTTVSNNNIKIDLDDTSVSSGNYGSASSIPVISVDAQGRITNVNTVTSVPTAELGVESARLSATAIVNGTAYGIKTLGNTDFASIGAQSVNISATSNPQLVDTREYIITSLGSTLAASATSVSRVYKIVSLGGSDFTTIGAASNTVGLAFTATGAGSGSGTVVEITNWITLGAGSLSSPPSVGDRFRARGTGNSNYGTGTVLETLFTATGNGSGTGTVCLDTTHFITFIDSTSGTSKIFSESGLQYNPGKGTIFASNLDGQFTGRFEGTFKGSFDSTTTIGQSDAALTVTVTQHDDGDTPSGDNLFLVGIESAVSGVGQTIKADSRIYYSEDNDKLVVNAISTSGNVDVGGNLTVTGTTTFNGGTITMGDADTDNVVFGADVNSSIIPNTDDAYDLGSSTQEWRDLFIDGTANIDSLVADTADINGGTIDGATIATSDITIGSGKTLDVSAGTLTLADDQISGDNVEGGTIAATTITTLTSTTVDTTNIEVTNLKAKDGTAAGSIADSTGKVTLNDAVLTTADINGGTIDGATIATSDITVGAGKTLDVSSGTLTLADNQISGDKVEGGTINAVTITTLTSTTGNITNVNATTLDTTNIEVTNLKAKDGTAAGSIADSTGVVTLGSSVLTTTDINGGTIDGTTIATSDITVASGKTLNVSAGTLTLADNQISGDKVEGGTINAVTITNLASTNVDTETIEVSNLKARDGTSAGSIADSTGKVTLNDAILTTADINGGTIDGSNITVGSGKTLDVSAGTLTLADNQISGDKIEGGTIAATTITDLTFGSLNDGSITITAFVDEDNMFSDSATAVPTQQSVKAYVDSSVATQDLAFTGDTGGSGLRVDLNTETFTIAGGTGLDTAGSGQTLTINIDNTVATLTGSQTFTNKTLTSPVLNTGVSGTAINTDLSSVSSNDDTLASAKAIKTYVDSQVTAQDLDFAGDTGGALSIDLDAESLIIAGGTGLDTAGSGNTITINIDNTVATLTGSQTFTNKTLTSPVLNTGVSGTAINTDLSSVSSNDDTLASAKAIKTYADSKDITVNAVTNETTVNRTGNAITVGLPNNVTVAGTLTVAGTGTSTAISIPNKDNVILGSIQSVSGLNYNAPVGGDLTIHEGDIILKGDDSTESGITWTRFNSTLSVTNSTYSIYGTSTLRYIGGRFDFTATTGTDNKVAEVRANNFRATNGFSRASYSAGPLLTTGSDNAWSTGDSASHGTTILYAASGSGTSRIKADITVDAPAASGNTFALETSSSYPYADVSGVTDLSKKVAISTSAADADTDAEFPVVFINNTGGNTYSSVNYHDLEKDAGILKYNPNTGTLSATSFVGNIAGSSTVAEKVTVVNEESASASHFLAFVDGVSSSRDIHADSGLTYVPSTGTLTVDNLTVAGTTTTLNTATLDVADTNITIAKNATTLAGINGAGLTFGNFSSNPVFSWDNGNSRFKFNKNTHIEGTLTANIFSGSFTGDILAANGTTVIDVAAGGNASFSGVSSRVTVNNYNNSTAYNLVLHNGNSTLLHSQLYSPTITTNSGLLTIPGATIFNGNITLGSNARLTSNILPSPNGNRNLGSTSLKFANVHATRFTGDVAGDVYASNGTSKVLEAGTDGTDATFTGSVTGSVTGNVTGDITGDVYASNGTSKVLEAGTNGTDATFTGDVTGDITGDVYASNGTSKVLEAGTNGTDATFTGNVTGDVTGAISFTGASSFASASTLNFANVVISNLTPDDLDDSGSTKQFYTNEKVDDRVGSILVGSENIDVTYDDANAQITIGQSLTTTDITEGNNLYYTNERVDDRVNALISVSNSGLSKTYDDNGNSLTLAIDLNGLTAADIDSSQDSIVFIDSTNNGSRKESIADFATNFVNGANSALTASSGKLSLNLNGLASEVLSVPNDSIVFIDADGSASKKESVADFVGAIAGTNLTQDSTNKTLGILTETIEDIVGAMFTDTFVTYTDNGASNGTITISQSTSSGVNIGGSEDNTNHYLLLSSGAAGGQSLLTDAILRFDTTDDTLSVPKLAITDNLTLSGATVSSAINPNANNTLDIGSTSSRWKDIYIAGDVNFGNLNDGTNSIGSFVTTINLTPSNTKVPTEGAVKTYVDGKTTTAAVADGGSNLATGDQIHTFVTGQNYVTSSGVTDISVDTGLDITNSTTTPTISLDLSELTDMTAVMTGTDEFIVLDAGSERRKAANEIGLSIFSNDSSFTSNAGTVTSIASGNGLQTNQAGSAAINDSGSLSIKLASGSGLSVGSGGLSTDLAVEGLNNVTISSLASGQILKYNGTVWVNATDVGTTQASATTLGIAKFDDQDFDVNSGTGNVTLETVFTGTPQAFGSSDTAAGSTGQKKVIGTITIDSKGRVTAVAEKTLTGFVPDSAFYNQAGIMVSDGDGTYSRRDIASTIADGDTKIPTSDAVHSLVESTVSGLLTQTAADGRYFQSGGSDNINATHLDFGQGTNQITIDNIPEKSTTPTNLYFTNARADDRIANAIKDEDDMFSDSATHAPSQQSVKAYVAAQIATKDNTDEITEGSTNLYFTNARADARIAAADTDSLSEGSTNLYFTNARADARIANNIIDEDGFDTDSATRAPSQQSVKAFVAAQIATKDNSDEITEGSTNLYFTDARARTAIGQGTGVSYDNSTGAISIGQEVGTTSNVTFNNLTINGNTTLGNATTDTTSVSGNLTVAGNTTLGNATTDTTSVSGNLNVAGDLTVSGGSFTVDATSLSVKDSLIELARDNSSSDLLDIGLYGKYSTSELYAGLFRDASDGKWKLFEDAQNGPSSNVIDIDPSSNTGYTKSKLVADLEGTADVATKVTVTANNTESNSLFIPFVDGDSGNRGLETDNQLRYNPSTGRLSAGNIQGTFIGNLTGNVTGNITGNITGGLTGNVSGNAGSATVLQNSRAFIIRNEFHAFDGTQNVNLTNAIGTLFPTNEQYGTSISYDSSGGVGTEKFSVTTTALYNGTTKKLEATSTAVEATAHIIPSVHNTYDLGSSAKRFRKIFVEEGEFAANTITVGTKTISSDSDGIIVSGDLTATNITGSLTGNVTGAADTLTTPRNFTVGSTDHSFNGSADINLTEAVQDAVAAMFTHSNHTSISASYDDTNGEIDLTSSGGSGSAGDPIVSVSENAPSSPSAGSLWFDPSDLTPYLYYNDGNSAQWIEFTPGGGGGSTNIGISETAPSSPASGDLWFDPSDLTPYIYYNDGNSNQWIQFTPGGNSGSRDANWSIKTSAYSSGSNEKLIFTGSSALTLTLPASPAAGNFIQIKNKTTQNLTVNRNGNNIESAASNAIVSSGTLTEFVYVDSTQGWIEL